MRPVAVGRGPRRRQRVVGGRPHQVNAVFTTEEFAVVTARAAGQRMTVPHYLAHVGLAVEAAFGELPGVDAEEADFGAAQADWQAAADAAAASVEGSRLLSFIAPPSSRETWAGQCPGGGAEPVGVAPVGDDDRPGAPGGAERQPGAAAAERHRGGGPARAEHPGRVRAGHGRD